MRDASPPPLGVADALSREAIEWWLRETDEARLETLWAAADEARRRYVGDAVHLRGLVEVSNYCVRGCTYCGIRAGNRGVERYRVSEDVVLDCAHKAVEFGYGTLVMQSGEDYGITTEWMAGVLRRIRSETSISAITLSLGERPDEDLALWREAGGDRYLLRFETSDDELYRRIHPDLPGKVSDRMHILRAAAGARLRGRHGHHGRHPRPDARQHRRRHRAVPRHGHGHDRHRPVPAPPRDAAGAGVRAPDRGGRLAGRPGARTASS